MPSLLQQYSINVSVVGYQTCKHLCFGISGCVGKHHVLFWQLTWQERKNRAKKTKKRRYYGEVLWISLVLRPSRPCDMSCWCITSSERHTHIYGVVVSNSGRKFGNGVSFPDLQLQQAFSTSSLQRFKTFRRWHVVPSGSTVQDAKLDAEWQLRWAHLIWSVGFRQRGQLLAGSLVTALTQ